jgi:hypothetical protein
MAKIIREGVKPGWWIGQVADCGGCGTQFRVEDTDPAWEKDKMEGRFGRVTETVVFVECPTCQRPVSLPLPTFDPGASSVSV